MKKFVAIFVAICLAFALVACGTTGAATGDSAASAQRKVPGGFPQFVKDALMNGPENVLVGVGTAKLASLSQSRTISANRARAEISRQLNTVVQDMIRDFQASSEVDPESALSFQENITVSLSKANVSGTRVVEQDIDEQGNVWSVVYFEAAKVSEIIDQAKAASKLSPAANASFDAEARMKESMAALNNEEVQVGDN